MSLNWARFQLAFQPQKAPFQPKILEMIFFLGVQNQIKYFLALMTVLSVEYHE